MTCDNVCDRCGEEVEDGEVLDKSPCPYYVSIYGQVELCSCCPDCVDDCMTDI